MELQNRGGLRIGQGRGGMVRLWAALTAMVVVASGLVGVSAPKASAWPGFTPHPTTVSADALPTVQINGVVWAQAVVGDTVYVGGSFTQARPAGGGTAVARNNMLAYNIVTGALITSFAPNPNAQVRTITASPDGSRIYVGGDFTSIAGATRSRLAAFTTSNNALVGNFTPSVGYHVYDISVRGNGTASTVYIGGNFTNVGSQYRGRLAAFNSTGTLLSWAPDASDRQVWAVQVSPDGSQVAVAGQFETLNGTTTFGRGFAVVDAVTGAIQPFAATALVRNGGVDGGITELFTDGDLLYGSGYTFGRAAGTLEGIFAAQWGAGTVRWINDCHGDTHSVFARGDVVYSAGHAHYCGNMDGFMQPEGRADGSWDWYRGVAHSKAVAGTIWTERLGYTNFAGQPRPDLLNWFPALSAGTYTGMSQGPWDVTGDSRYIVMGGEFLTVNGQAQQGLVRFAARTTAPNDQGPQLFNDTYPIKVRSFKAGTVTISWQGNRDRDTAALRYQVFRRTGGTGNGTVVHTRSLTAPWWDLPVMTYTDTTASGTGYQYRVQVDDSNGNVANSPWTTVTAAPVQGDYLTTVLASEPDSLWRLGESAGSTVATDTVGWREATIPATGVTVGQPGAIVGDADTAATFDGAASTSRVTSTIQELTLPQVFSLEAWVKTAPSANGGLIIGYNQTLNNDGSTSRHDRVLYMDTSGHLRFGVNPTTPVAIGPNTDYRDNEWHHVVGTLGAGGMKMYVDGALVDQRADITNARTGYTGYVRIGAGALNGFPGTDTTTGRRFEGQIDDAALYRKALPLSRIAEHYRASGRTLGEVNEPPTAAFTATPNGFTVAFNGSTSSDADGQVKSWAWTFGDGASQTTSTATTSHTYAAGTWTASLVVTDDDNAASLVAATRTFTVTAPPANVAPTAAFTAATSDLTVSVDGSGSADSDGTVESWAWNFGDGSPVVTTTTPTASHTYVNPGPYTVSLVVTDDDAATSEAVTRDVTATSPPAVVAADAFARTVASGWGNADTGGAWTTTAASSSVSGGTGRITIPTSGAGRNAYLNSVSTANADITAQVTLDKVATGGGMFVSVVGRRVTTPAAADYRLKLQYQATGPVRAFLTRTAGSTETTITTLATVPGLTGAPGEVVNVRFQMQGTGTTALRAKVWVGGSEPATWQLSANDTTAALQVPGSVGFVNYLSGSANNAPVTVVFDNVRVASLN